MQAKPLIKQIKIIPLIFLLMMLSGTAISIYACVSSVGDTRILEVSKRRLKVRTIKHVDIGENSFATGYEGQLYWKVKNLKEAFLVSLAERESSTNFYDLFYFLVLDIILFIMVYRINEETIFSEQVIVGFILIGCSVMFYAVVGMLSYKISKWSVEELTNGQFSNQLRHSSVVKYLYITYLILFMAPFLKKAMNLEKEQNLTV